MTDTQRHDVCEAMWVANIFNERLNTALKNDTQASLSGDAAIATFVQLLYSKLSFIPYKQAVEALADQLGINLAVAPAPVPEPPKAPAPVPVPQPAPTPPAPPPATVPAPSGDFAAQVLAVLAANNVHIIPGKLAIGMKPDPMYDAALQLGDTVAAEILGVSNTRKTDKQNEFEIHKNVISVAGNDGGIRLIQYLGWGPLGKIRNTLNRRASILALDSMGDLCKSTEEIGQTSDGGQSWYIRTNGAIVEFCTYKVGGFIRFMKSIFKYGDTVETSWTNQ